MKQRQSWMVFLLQAKNRRLERLVALREAERDDALRRLHQSELLLRAVMPAWTEEGT